MHVAGIDAHATYVVVAIVSNDGAVVQNPIRIKNAEPQRLTDVLAGAREMTLQAHVPEAGAVRRTATRNADVMRRTGPVDLRCLNDVTLIPGRGSAAGPVRIGRGVA